MNSKREDKIPNHAKTIPMKAVGIKKAEVKQAPARHGKAKAAGKHSKVPKHKRS